MLQRKQKKVAVVVPTLETKETTVPTKAGLKSAAADSVETVQARAGAKLDDAKAKAMPLLAAAGAAVAPKLGEARDKVENDVLPRVADTRDHLAEAKDSFVEETLPKIIEAVTGAVAASSVAKSDALAKVRDSEAAHRAADAAAVLKGDKVAADKKSGGFFSGLLATLGLLAAAGGLAWFFNKRSVEQDDPWARPLADPYIPPATGRESTFGAGIETAAPATGLGQDAPATFTPEAGQVSDVPVENTELVPPADQAVADQEIRVVDPMAFDTKPEERKGDEHGI